MGNAFFVVWRESLEAFLIAGILYAWLKGNDDTGKGKRALFAGLAAGVGLALLLGWALLTVQDELRKATAEKRGVDAPGPSPFYSLAMSAVPGKLVPMGQGENAAWGMSIVSGHPAEPDRDYIFARSLLNKQYVELKALIQQMMPFALPWSVDRSKELDG